MAAGVELRVALLHVHQLGDERMPLLRRHAREYFRVAEVQIPCAQGDEVLAQRLLNLLFRRELTE